MSARAFVGRQHELDALLGALERARSGEGGALAVVGEPGIGKSRLVAELARRAAPTLVLWGRCWESGGAPPGWPWREILRALVPATSSPPHVARALAAWLPELGEAPRHVSADARFELYAAVSELLQAAASRAPLVLVLEDLHAADRATLELMRLVVQQAAHCPLLVVSTWRATEASARPDASDLVTPLLRAQERVALGALAPNDARTVLEGVRAGLPERLLGPLLASAGGNPLFLEELARGLQDGPGATTALALDDAIAAHLATLTEPALELGGVAAMLGRSASLGLLRRAAREALFWGEREIGAALDELVRADVVVAGEEGASFRHVLVRDALVRRSGPERRARLCTRLLGALLELRTPLALVARIALDAVPELPAATAASYARSAAAEARDALDYDASSTLLQRALELREGSGEPADATLCELRLELAESLIVAGQVSRGRDLAASAGALAQELELPEHVARAALVFGSELILGKTDPRLTALLEAGLALLPQTPTPLRARLLGRYATALFPHRDARVPLQVADEALAASTHFDSATRLQVLDACRFPMILTRPVRLYRPIEEEHYRLVGTHGGARQRTLAAVMVAFARLADRDVVGAEAAMSEADRESEAFRQPQQRFRILLGRSMLALRRGRFAEADAWVERARELVALGPTTTAIDVFLFHAWGHLRVRRDVAGMIAVRPKIVATSARHPTGWALRAGLAALVGDLEAARVELAARDALLWGRPPPLLVAASEAAIGVGDRALAEELYEVLLPRAGEIAVWGMVGIFAESAIDLTLAHLAAFLGRDTEAAAHFERTLAIEAETGATPLEAHAHADFARFLSARGDPAGAATHRARARLLLASVGLSDAEAEAEVARTSAPPPPVSARPAASTQAQSATPLPVFERDGELFTIRLGADSVHVKGGKGIRYLAVLAQRPGRELHVLELVAAEEGIASPADLHSDAGEILDHRARDAYRRRARELREHLQDAEEDGDAARALGVRAELEALEDQLRAAIGRGGRARKDGDAAERARVNVQRRLRAALETIERSSPELARHFTRSVRTGTFCAYDPPAFRIEEASAATPSASRASGRR